MIKSLPFFLLLLSLGGCAVNGEYACGVPENGVKCQSLGETHKQLNEGTLPSLYTEPFPEDDDSTHQSADLNSENSGPVWDDGNSTVSNNSEAERIQQPIIETVSANQAILSQPREMRIWFDRFTDPEGDLHDESFVFIRIDNGHWVIDNKPVLY